METIIILTNSKLFPVFTAISVSAEVYEEHPVPDFITTIPIEQETT